MLERSPCSSVEYSAPVSNQVNHGHIPSCGCHRLLCQLPDCFGCPEPSKGEISKSLLNKLQMLVGFGMGTTPGDAQCLLLSLYSGITHSRAWGTVCGARDRILVACEQDSCPLARSTGWNPGHWHVPADAVLTLISPSQVWTDLRHTGFLPFVVHPVSSMSQMLR